MGIHNRSQKCVLKRTSNQSILSSSSLKSGNLSSKHSKKRSKIRAGVWKGMFRELITMYFVHMQCPSTSVACIIYTVIIHYSNTSIVWGAVQRIYYATISMKAPRIREALRLLRTLATEPQAEREARSVLCYTYQLSSSNVRAEQKRRHCTLSWSQSSCLL